MWKVEKKGNVTVVSLKGRITATESHELQGNFERELGGGAKMAVDMSGVEYISSCGLRVFLSALKQARQKGGDVRLCSLAPPVQRVFKIAGMEPLFKIFPGLDEALASF